MKRKKDKSKFSAGDLPVFGASLSGDGKEMYVTLPRTDMRTFVHAIEYRDSVILLTLKKKKNPVLLGEIPAFPTL